MRQIALSFPLSDSPSLWERLMAFITRPEAPAAAPAVQPARQPDITPPDFADYVFYREYGNNTLVGIIAGLSRDRSGALLTMIARTALEDAIRLAGEMDPAGILRCADGDLAHLLDGSCDPLSNGRLAAAFVYVDRDQGLVRFAGAGMDLLVREGGQIRRRNGSFSPLNMREKRVYTNGELSFHGEACFEFHGNGAARELLYHSIVLH